MKHNKKGQGDLWSTITRMAFILLLVAVVIIIVFKLLGVSFSSIFGIFEPYKKMFGFGDEKAKQVQDSTDCKIIRFYWSTDKSKPGPIDIFVEGNDKCNYEKAYISIYADYGYGLPDKQVASLIGPFDQGVSKIPWKIEPDASLSFQGYYFKVKVGNLESAESKRLQVG